MNKHCRTCIYAATAKPEDPTSVDGWCHRNPPVLFGNQSTFVAVNLDRFWCGEHKISTAEDSE
ncbi:MAG TPA: hypothetical protein VNZ94_00455 [Xanthobacteraceae bacterium]|nr:hypothetical protein [Xanthobacteraceae bacterium]